MTADANQVRPHSRLPLRRHPQEQPARRSCLTGARKREIPRQRYYYDPHICRPSCDSTKPASPTACPNCWKRPRAAMLTAEEANILADALRNRQPWLEWSWQARKAMVRG